MPSWPLKTWVWISVALGFLRFIWLRDVTLVNDDQLLLHLALKGNASGEWVQWGLRGTRGVDYGPFAIWIYQVLLKVAHDPFWLVSAKIVLCTAGTVVGVTSLLGTFAFLPRWVGVVPMLSPYLWVYARDLWDNSFLIPVTACLAAAHFRFLFAPTFLKFFSVALACTLAVLTHLMAAPIVAGTAAHLLWRHWRWVLKHAVQVTLTLLFLAFLAWPYFAHLRELNVGGAFLGPKIGAFVFAFMGARQFTAAASEYFFGWAWFWQFGAPWNGIVTAGVGLSVLALLASFRGMARAVKAALAKGQRPEKELGIWISAVLFLFVVNATLTQIVSHPHYYNAVWTVFFLCAAWGATGGNWSRKLAPFYLAGLAISLVGAASLVHINGGNRELRYGMTLGEQWKAGAELACYPDKVQFYDERERSFWESVWLMRSWQACSGTPRTDAKVRLRYRDPANPWDAHAVVEPKD
ncbi:hypothetical protein K2X33_05680 [bacterium]|nr:hypothetical protein [bacterium]